MVPRSERVLVFEENIERYEAWFERNRNTYLEEVKFIGDFIPEKGTGLEVGVGTGRFSVPFGVKIGVDPSEKALRIAKSRGILCVRGVGEALPFKNSTFDFVLMVTTICFLESPEASFREVFRVLKKGGVFIVGFVDADSPLGALYRKKDSPFYRVSRFFSRDDVDSLLRNAGFVDVDCFSRSVPVAERGEMRGFAVARGFKRDG